MLKNYKKQKITRLKKEIQVKDLIIKQLFLLVSENKVKVPESLLQTLTLLYAGNKDGNTEH